MSLPMIALVEATYDQRKFTTASRRLPQRVGWTRRPGWKGKTARRQGDHKGDQKIV